MNRDTTISISKGIAIILMVIAHAEAPGWLCKFIFEFHMPLFFITAGYFFSLKYLNDEATFETYQGTLLAHGKMVGILLDYP